MIPYGRQSVGQAEIDAVVEVLRGEKWTQGPKIGEFELALSAKTSAPFVAAVCNGTAALHLACLALDLGPGDRLWATPISFVASANCARYCGAEVDFIDIDPQTRNLSVGKLAQKLQRAKAENRLPKILVAVHFAGLPCDMAAIWELSQEYGFSVIEDAAHALGSFYRDTAIGSCRYSHITTFSFHPVKTIATGEGGAVCCRSEELGQRIKMLASHGIERNAQNFTHHQQQPWYYEQQLLGFNYRLTDIQAALGVVQLQRLGEFVAKRRELVTRYNQLLTTLPLTLPVEPPQHLAAWHIYVVEMAPQIRDAVIARLHERKIASNVHYHPIHLQPHYRKLGFTEGDFPEAEAYARRALTLPLYPELSFAEQDQVVSALESVL
ncbi:MAG: UDP-4-amino-4,6-dideoxy-N-acetyl-beta-L-altrosamine transaminase [Cellvibrionaceae bacterium]|nr:UDP-4-amino-4,6-dideoxy-N-acetyl-beta-L-altrosamine transaminase [Cellvibrionaceae bacterium]